MNKHLQKYFHKFILFAKSIYSIMHRNLNVYQSKIDS